MFWLHRGTSANLPSHLNTQNPTNTSKYRHDNQRHAQHHHHYSLTHHHLLSTHHLNQSTPAKTYPEIGLINRLTILLHLIVSAISIFAFLMLLQWVNIRALWGHCQIVLLYNENINIKECRWFDLRKRIIFKMIINT